MILSRGLKVNGLQYSILYGYSRSNVLLTGKE